MSSPSRRLAANSATSFQTCRFDAPSSYSATIARLGSTTLVVLAIVSADDRVEQVGGDADLQQPDRLEIGAEKQPRGPKHVIDVRIRRVPLDVTIENRRREPSVFVAFPHRRQGRRVHRTFGEPELVPIDPEAILEFARVSRSAVRTPMLVRLERIELEQ